jgi:hypothetical protein
MSFKNRIVSSFLALALGGGALGTAMQPSAAGSLSKAEAAAIAGVGGFILGAAVANAARGSDYYGARRTAWGLHVERCYAHYKTYDHRTDTFVGFDGQLHLCRL